MFHESCGLCTLTVFPGFQFNLLETLTRQKDSVMGCNKKKIPRILHDI